MKLANLLSCALALFLVLAASVEGNNLRTTTLQGNSQKEDPFSAASKLLEGQMEQLQSMLKLHRLSNAEFFEKIGKVPKAWLNRLTLENDDVLGVIRTVLICIFDHQVFDGSSASLAEACIKQH